MSKPTFPAPPSDPHRCRGVGLALFFGLLHLDGSAARVRMTPVYWADLLAPAFFLMALGRHRTPSSAWTAATPSGQPWSEGRRNGGFLMLGAFTAVVVQPSLIFLIGNSFREMRGVRFNLDIENLTLALVGLVLIMLARQGRKLKSKLDQFV